MFFTSEKDPETLYGPLGTQSRMNRVVLEDLYSEVVDEHMFSRHQLRVGRFAKLIVTTSTNGNLLTVSNMEEISTLHNTVLNV